MKQHKTETGKNVAPQPGKKLMNKKSDDKKFVCLGKLNFNSECFLHCDAWAFISFWLNAVESQPESDQLSL